MIRIFACIFTVAVLLAAGSQVAASALSPVTQAEAPTFDRPGDGRDDHSVCLCEVIGACSAQMGAQGGTSGEPNLPGRRIASPFDDRPPAGVVPEIPSPPPRVT